MNAPEFGDLDVGDNFQKHSYPLGIMVNANGVRFVDEGADFRNYTYAKYGAVILSQPQQFAWQIFDAKVLDKLRDEYRIKRVTKVRADTIEELATKLEGVERRRQFLKTIKEWNAAVMTEVPFNPAIKDGRSTRGLAVPKSHWANTIDQAPFEAYAVTCGLTFTFGGLKITTEGEVGAPTATPSPACSRRASWWAGSSITTIPAARAWCRAPSSASWRATARGATFPARTEKSGGNDDHPVPAFRPGPRQRCALRTLRASRGKRRGRRSRSPSSSAMQPEVVPTSWPASWRIS